MSCFRPLRAYRTDGGEVKIADSPQGGPLSFELPCGRCIGCRQDRARAWTIRIVHEAQLHESNLFLTLTYDDAHVPEDYSLNYRHFQLFLKKLRRKSFGSCLRYFVAGEYGDSLLRPHFHAIMFNLRFPDQRRLMNDTWRSARCEELWQHGGVVIGNVTPASAAYVAGYATKKALRGKPQVLFDPATGEIWDRAREFVRMSLKPGIGSVWYDRFASDILPGDFAVQDGKRFKVPRYYFEKFKVEDPCRAEEISMAREERARERRSENTPERRAVREEVAVLKARRFHRGVS